jgi:hypothetical protein
MDHCGSAASTRFDPAAGFSFDNASELLKCFGELTKIESRVFVTEEAPVKLPDGNPLQS